MFLKNKDRHFAVLWVESGKIRGAWAKPNGCLLRNVGVDWSTECASRVKNSSLTSRAIHKELAAADQQRK